MRVAGVLGHALIAAGPGVVLWCFFIAHRSFLVLLALASSFYWLTALIAISALLQVLVGYDDAGVSAVLVLAGVALQEAARFGSFHAQKTLGSRLSGISQQHAELVLTPADHTSMAFAHGMGHAWTILVFFYLCWLPLAAGDATWYLEACPQMSFFLYTALASTGLFLLNAFSMPVAYANLDRKGPWACAIIPGLHLVAALLMLANLAPGGCMFTAPLLLALPAVPLYLWWRQAAAIGAGYTEMT